MADMFDCIQAAIDARELDPARGRKAQDEFRQLQQNYARTFDDVTAAEMAAADLKKATQDSVRRRRSVVIHQLQTARRNQALIDAAENPADMLTEVLEHKEGRKGGALSVRFVQDALVRQFNGQMNRFLKENARNLVGGEGNPALMRNILRELFGEASDDPNARAMAQSIEAVRERARALFNAYGGDIGKLDNYGVRQTHNVYRLRKAGYVEWSEAVRDSLDWHRIIDHSTGQPFATTPGAAPANPLAADLFLQRIYDTITKRGAQNQEATFGSGGVALYNRRAEPRVLHFKNAEAWLKYHEAFGEGDAFTAIVGHIHGMARDIAHMQVLGPNPRAGLEHLIQAARIRASRAKDAKAEGRVQKQAVLARAMLAHSTGEANTAADAAWGAVFAGTRQVLTAAQLGSATLSAVTDMQTVRMAARAVGMNPDTVMARSMKLMASQASREEAAAMGFVADTLANAGSTANRYIGEQWSPEITSRMTDAVLRASGLSFWTDMNRVAFQMEFAGHMARQADRPLADVDPVLRNVLMDRGITAEDWDALRNTGGIFEAPNGAKFLTPTYFVEAADLPRNRAEGLAIRLGSIIQEQMEFAVPSHSLEMRAWLQGEAKPGTPYGEVLRSTTMYKGWAATFTMNQIRRTWAQPGPMSRAAYFGRMVAGMTLMGAVAVQLKELAKGRDPRPMDEGKFWGAALFQGGGLGIFGDLVYSETTRAGGGLYETIGGPVVGFASDVAGAGIYNAARALEGKDTRVGRDLTNLFRRYTPGTSIWYARTALDRAVWDQMQQMLDPEAATSWRRSERRREKAYGTSLWWDRGELSPDRGPDFNNIAGR